MSDEHCSICNEPITEDQDVECWGEVQQVHAECNPERTVGWKP
jgi:predicted nucleic acid-binding Zn ribbon protein